ncbi:MAG TPA: PEGA domain-containing protein [Chthoniobacter sp.]|nr:PEGA domain-containing protein [Chthoniobacter sp.]
MSISIRLLPFALAALTLPVSQAFFGGCATVTQGPLQKVQFDSKPVGATLYVNGSKVGKTPRLVVFSRFQKPRVRFELEGFEPYDLKMDNYAIWGAVEGNVMLGVAPIVIDAVTGSLYELSVPDQPGLTTNAWYKGDLSQFGRYKTLFVGVTLKPLSGGRKIGQMQPKR